MCHHVQLAAQHMRCDWLPESQESSFSFITEVRPELAKDVLLRLCRPRDAFARFCDRDGWRGFARARSKHFLL